MQLARLFFLLCCFLFVSESGYAQKSESRKVLFVGNSYTYFWNLPQNVALMAESKNIDLKTAQSTSGGVNLGHHWKGERNLETKEKIKSGNYDVVVLQDHSMRAIQHPDSLLYYGKLWGDYIKSNGGQPFVYLTWARKWDPYMQEKITEKYIELAKKINARVVPVGLAWQKVRELRPDLDLYDPDGSHPSTIGTYLTACVFFAAITNVSPIGLPHRLATIDADGETLFINIQDQNDALFCQKVAFDVISQFPD